jgi:hypothetical protein
MKYKFDTQDYAMAERYTSELRCVRTLEELKKFVDRWKRLWEVSGHNKSDVVEEVDKKIREGLIIEDDLTCIRLSFEMDKDGIETPCQHVRERLCVGMEIRLPWSMMLSTLVGGQYKVPECIAFHQLFCDDPNHIGCF